MMAHFIRLKHVGQERWVCTDHITSLLITRADAAGTGPAVEVYFVGGSMLELKGEAAGKFIETLDRDASSSATAG